MTVEGELLLSHSENWDEMGNESSVLQSENDKDWVVQDQGSFLKLACIQAMGRDTVTGATVQRGRRQKKTSIQESGGEGDSHCQYDLWCERKRNSYSTRSSFKACHWDKIMQAWTFTAVHTEHCELWSLRVQELNLQLKLDHSLLLHDRTPLYRRSNLRGEKRERGRKKWRGFYRAPEEGGGFWQRVLWWVKPMIWLSACTAPCTFSPYWDLHVCVTHGCFAHAY